MRLVWPLNGLYSFLFVFQVGSSIVHIINPVLYINYLNTFYWLNHLPHLVGIYLLMKKDFDVKGVHFGLIFVLFLMNLTFQILYINSQESLGINTVYRDYFFYILFFAVIWYIFLLFFYYKKKKEKWYRRDFLKFSSYLVSLFPNNIEFNRT